MISMLGDCVFDAAPLLVPLIMVCSLRPHPEFTARGVPVPDHPDTWGTGLFESGKVLLPNEGVVAAPWLLDFERELLAVPAQSTTTKSMPLCLHFRKRGTGLRYIGYVGSMFSIDDMSPLGDPAEDPPANSCPPAARNQRDWWGG